MKFKWLLITIAALLILLAKPALAESEAGISAVPKSRDIQETTPKKDLRAVKLETFLEEHNSPFKKEDIQTFILAAERNQLDWRLLPAITGIESTFGRFLPADSYNPFGWGIYADKVTRFKSYEEAIENVAQGLNQDYNTENIYRLASSYCPPNAGRWAFQVNALMEKIEETPLSSQDILVPEL